MNGSYVNGYSLASYREKRVHSQAILCKTSGRHSGKGKGFSHSTSAFPCQYHSTSDPD